ncbi:MAG TPA: NHL repeat-containing protein [Terracidiphilus sp.]
MPAPQAQTAHFVSAERTLGGGRGVAVDGNGNVFVTSPGWDANTVREILAVGGYATVNTLAIGFNEPTGVAVDGSGNVFVCNSGDYTVKEIVAAGEYTTVNTLLSYGCYPGAVAVDGNGNIFYADANNYWGVVKEIVAAGGYTTVIKLAEGFWYPQGLAVDAIGNVFVADTGNNLVKEIVAVNGSIPESPTIKTLGSGFTEPEGVALDGSGNVFVADCGYCSGTVKEIVAVNGSIPANPTIKTVGSEYDSHRSVAVDGIGNVFVGGFSGVKEILARADFDSVDVGSKSAHPISFYFAFDTDVTLGSTAVLTQGAKWMDFLDTTGGSCKAGNAYKAGDTCTVKVNFKPKRTGPRYGAVELLDTAGSLMATAYMQGTGMGPQVNFAKVTSGVYLPSGQKSLGSGFNDLTGVAVDQNGNVFVADTDNSAVKEILAAGGYTTVKTLGSGFSYPHGVALDGAGNVFVADTDNSAVKEILAVGGYTTVKTLGSGFSYPRGVAVDGVGNVFVADYNNGAVKEISAVDGYATVTTLGSGSMGPKGVAVDDSGNVFVADYDNGAVKKILAAGGYKTVKTLGSGFSGPTGVAVDGNGDVLVADYGHSAVKELLAASGYTTIRTLGGSSGSYGVAVDGFGNVFIADADANSAVKLDYVHAPQLHFAGADPGLRSSDSPLRVAVSNVGNAALTLPVPSSGNNPSVSGGFKLDAATTCPNVGTGAAEGTLANGKTCFYAVDFVPAVSGTNTGSLVLTDTSLNSTGTQSVVLSGKSLDVPFGALGLAVDNVTLSSTVGQLDSLLVQGWVGDPVDGAPLANVKVYVDGVSIGTPTLGLARPDVAAKYGNAYLNSGYRMVYAASSLSVGTHKVTVVAVDAGGRSTTFGPLTITVQ